MDAESAATTEDASDSTGTTPTDVELQAFAEVSDEEFERLVKDTLESVGGTLLFKVRIVEEGKEVHAAAAVFGLRRSRQFLLLTLPVTGGQLKVETASRSHNPLAGIAESYAGLLDALNAAA